MITKDEKNYLRKIPASKKASIKPFNPRAKKAGGKIIAKIKGEIPNLEVLFMGATALEIAGQNDIDIYALSKPKDFDKYLPSLEKLFGKAKHVHKSFIEWKFKKNNFDVEFYLTDPTSPTMRKQIRVFEVLKSNRKLLKKYEDFKLPFDSKSLRDYHRAKYEFYNGILNSNKILQENGY